MSMDGTRLEGWFARPAKANRDVIILFHGVGDNREGMMGLARLFLSRGYAVLMPDSRGHGASRGVPSYGIREVSDAHQWFDWLIRNDSPQYVFGLGMSMGTAILLQSISIVPFCAVVAESSFADFRQVAYIRVGQFFHAGSWVGQIVFRPAVDLAFLYRWLRYGVRLADASPVVSVVGSRVPVLLIHGLADADIPLEQSEMILSRNPGDITLWRVPNAGHCGAMSVAGREYDERVLGWFESHRPVVQQSMANSNDVLLTLVGAIPCILHMDYLGRESPAILPLGNVTAMGTISATPSRIKRENPRQPGASPVYA
jgi:dipeptidyl aminopeptidase/acylaminoacyl peptidase